MATSTPQASMSNGMQPSEATASTMSSASCPAARIAWPIAGMSLTTPDAVSICATRMALIVPPLSAFSRASTSAGRTARRMSPFRTSTSTPMRRALSPQLMAKRPLSSTRILSPLRQHVGERGLPGAVAVGDVDVGAALGVEHAGDVAQQAVGQREQRPGIDVHRRPVHGPQHLVRHRRRPGNGQEFTPRSHAHLLPPLAALPRLAYQPFQSAAVARRCAIASPCEPDLRSGQASPKEIGPPSHGIEKARCPPRRVSTR